MFAWCVERAKGQDASIRRGQSQRTKVCSSVAKFGTIPWGGPGTSCSDPARMPTIYCCQGLEVKPNQSVNVSPDDEHFLHLSQGALGEVKKDDKATMFVKIGDQKLAIRTLSTDKFPQIQFDLVFEKEFELSHNSKTSSLLREMNILFYSSKNVSSSSYVKYTFTCLMYNTT
ncbi:unnamed protein product [Triticum aestivum]|uniref:Nucleoplasmin-like domain-containing protein n=5 Tax=Triticinae TaxID=1648030 RepID=A0A453DLJ6_AEGTS|nr:histone deacetylase HDT2 [Aegilops tauschii subsp. strangulata]SPT20983.1 unnamed protein product [Triticum aestivum]